MSRTYDVLAVKNGKAYCASVARILEEVRPICILPSHGEKLSGPLAVDSWKQETFRKFS